MDDIPAWEVFGTSYGFSSIGIPISNPALDSFNKAISVWVDEKIQSESSMAVLAESDIDMDHPCVRVYTKEEVDANRKFLVASAESFKMHEFLQVRSILIPTVPYLTFAQKVSAEKVQSGEIKVQVIGKHVGSPESVLEFLKKRMLTVEKQRDGLKPQWLRDWQDSRRRGQSAPP
jgi:hypothetical protein